MTKWIFTPPTDDDVGRKVFVRRVETNYEGDDMSPQPWLYPTITYHVGTVVDIFIDDGNPTHIGLRGIQLSFIKFVCNSITTIIKDDEGAIYVPFSRSKPGEFDDTYSYVFIDEIK